jgi:hypothetical protein
MTLNPATFANGLAALREGFRAEIGELHKALICAPPGEARVAPDGTIKIFPVRAANKDDHTANEWDEAFGKPSTQVR